MLHGREEKKSIPVLELRFSDLLAQLLEIEKKPTSEKIDQLKESIQKSNATQKEKSDVLEAIQAILQKPESAALPSEAKRYQKFCNPETYNKLLQYAKLAHLFEKDGSPENHAFKLAAFFKTPDDALSFLVKFSKNNATTKIVHDACLFTLPDPGNFSAWQTLSKAGEKLLDPEFKYMLSLSKDLEKLHTQNAADEKSKTSEQKESKADLEKEFKKLNDKCHSYEHSPSSRIVIGEEEYKKLLEERKACQVKLSYFSAKTPFKQLTIKEIRQYLTRLLFQEQAAIDGYLLKNGIPEDKRMLFHSLDRSKAGSEMPDILMDCKEVDLPGFYFKKLDVAHNIEEAAKAACLGKLTGNCQSLSGEAGEPCTRHGLTSSKGAFYVLCKGDAKHPQIEDEVYAQSWAWLSHNGSLQFDSIERRKSPHHNAWHREEEIDIYSKDSEKRRNVYAAAALKWVMEKNIQQVRVGASDIFNGLINHHDSYFVGENQIPVDYKEYSEAAQQIRLASAEYPELALCWLPKKQQDVYWETHLKLESKLTKGILEQKKRIIDAYLTVFSSEKNRPFIENLYQKIQEEKNPDLISHEKIMKEYVELCRTAQLTLEKLEEFKKAGVNFEMNGLAFEAFHTAVTRKDEDIALFFAAELSDVNQKTDFGRKPKSMLDVALETESIKLITLLLDRGATLNDIEALSIESILEHAMEEKEFTFLNLLAQKLPRAVFEELSEHSKTELSEFSIKEKDVSLFKFIDSFNKKDHRMQINRLNDAINDSNRDKINFLLDHVVNLLKMDSKRLSDDSDDENDAGVEEKQEAEHPTVESDENGYIPPRRLCEILLLVSAELGWKEVLEKIVSEKMQIYAMNREALTALMSAVSNNQLECVKVLLTLPYDLDFKNPLGKTVFDMTSDETMLKLLRSHQEAKVAAEAKVEVKETPGLQRR